MLGGAGEETETPVTTAEPERHRPWEDLGIYERTWYRWRKIGKIDQDGRVVSGSGSDTGDTVSCAANKESSYRAEPSQPIFRADITVLKGRSKQKIEVKEAQPLSLAASGGSCPLMSGSLLGKAIFATIRNVHRLLDLALAA